MQSVLRQAFEVSSSHYLEFLLGFFLRDPTTHQSSLLDEVTKSTEIRLPSRITKGAKLNDLDLVPLHQTAFIKLSVTLDPTSKTHLAGPFPGL